MATIAQIRADLVGSSASFRAEMIAGQRQANQSLASIRGDVKATAESLITLNKAAAGFVGFEAIKAGVQNLLDAQKAAQQIHYSLLSATGSTTVADAAYKAVSATAEHLGLDLQSSALGFSAMAAAASANGVSMRDQQALFDGLARSATVLHLSAEQTGRAITALSQIFGKGKIQAEELRQQLGDAVPGVVPRFQAAVLAMTKGTDLAGKSFDQLLQSGDLTVQRFLPALVQALNDTGRGAEQAAGGLNASINRLSTEWFKLKTDLSGGLFSDAAMASIDLVTRNLSNLADVAGITGGVVLARFAGGGLSQAAGGASALVSQQREARAAAVAASELAQANIAAATAEVRQNEAALAGVATARQQALAQRDAAQALYGKALAENEAAQATLAHQSTAATLSANIRAQREATANAAMAQQNLARAQAQYDGAIAGSNSLKQQQIALEARLIESRAASAAATEAQVVAERQLSATGAFGIAQRGAASLANFALGLVGGPWGAAVAAIGAVGYAIYDTQKRTEDYRKETDELAKSIQQVREEAELATKTFGALDGSMTFKQGVEQYKQESAAIAEQRSALADLEAQADAIRARISSRSSGTAGGAFANLFDQRELAGVNERIAALQAQLGPASAAVDALGNKMSGVLAPSIGDVKRALAELANGKSILDVVFDLSSGADKGIASADAALASLRSGLQAFQSGAKELTDKAVTDGMNNAQKAAYLYQQRLKDIDKLPVAQRSGARSSLDEGYTPYLQAAQRLDAADAAKKAATQAINQARQWQQQADSLNQSLLQTHNELTAQLDSTQRLTPAQKQLQDIVGGTNNAYNHASAALKAKMLAQAEANAELSKSIVLQQQETAAAARSAALQDQLASRIQRQAEGNAIATASVGHGQQLTQQLQDELRIRQEYDRQRQQYDKEAGRLQAGTAGSIGSDQYNDDIARMQASQLQELAIYRAGVQQRLDAEHDWRNGAQAALEDYADSAANAAGQTQQAFSNAFGTLEDDLVKGKLNFTSFANSVIEDMLRIQVRGGLGVLAQYGTQALGSLFGYDASGGAGTSTYNAIGAVTHVAFGGGRATGGATAGGTLYEVAERGPELYRSGGRTYLLSGQDGHVTPAGAGGASAPVASAPGFTVNIINNAPVQVTQKQGRDSNGMPTIDVLIDAIDAGLADRVSAGRSRTGNAMAQRMGTNMATNL
ncbi:tape measure protein [Luteibacter sp. PPL201]|uniref:Tape measure protein n=1 Tax=Luteibacter sahnii TaxID=3021977 RepID=A0ABT6B7S2_9GAMM